MANADQHALSGDDLATAQEAKGWKPCTQLGPLVAASCAGTVFLHAADATCSISA